MQMIIPELFCRGTLTHIFLLRAHLDTLCAFFNFFSFGRSTAKLFCKILIYEVSMNLQNNSVASHEYSVFKVDSVL